VGSSFFFTFAYLKRIEFDENKKIYDNNESKIWLERLENLFYPQKGKTGIIYIPADIVKDS